MIVSPFRVLFHLNFTIILTSWALWGQQRPYGTCSLLRAVWIRGRGGEGGSGAGTGGRGRGPASGRAAAARGRWRVSEGEASFRWQVHLRRQLIPILSPLVVRRRQQEGAYILKMVILVMCILPQFKKHLYINHCSHFIHNRQKMKTTQCPWNDEWINKVWYDYTMEYYLPTKRN